MKFTQMCPQDVGSFAHACYTSVKKLSQLWEGGMGDIAEIAS